MPRWLTWLLRSLGGLLALVLLLLAAGWVYEYFSEQADSERLKPPGRLVDIGGRRMHLSCMGHGTPLVVLEPGAAEFSLLANALQRRVARLTRVCTYDRAGYGWSDPAPPGRRFEARADDLHRLLQNARETGPLVLVGGSYGGFLVRTFTRQHPAEVAGMVLVDAAEEKTVFDNLPLLLRGVELQRTSVLLARFGVMRLAMAHLIDQARAEGRIPPDANPQTVTAAAALTSTPAYWQNALDESTAYAQTPATQRRPGGFGTLGDRPLVVIRHGKPFSGINASLAPLEAGWTAGQVRLAALSHDSRLVVAAANSHDIIVENPALVAEAVREVVESVRTGQPLSGR